MWRGCCHFFTTIIFITVQSYLLCAREDSHPTLYCTKTWYHLSISDPVCGLQKILTALFDLVWNTKKSKWPIF